MSLNVTDPSAPVDPAAALEQYAKDAFSSDLGLNLGPLIIGLAFDLVLFGVMVHQFTIYLASFESERRLIRFLVFWLMAVGTAATVWDLRYIWWLFVESFGTYANFFEMTTMGWCAILAMFVTVPAQIFYLERAYRLQDRAKWIIVIVVPLIIASMVGSIGPIVTIYSATDLDGLANIRPFFYLYTSSSLAIDACLTTTIAISLMKSKTGWSDTDQMIGKLVRMSVEAQIAPTVMWLAFLVTYSLYPDSQVNYFFAMCSGKTYVVPLLSVLNSRTNLRTGLNGSGARSKTSSRVQGMSYKGRSDRYHQDTMDMGDVHITTDVFETSHPVPQERTGVNRQRLPDLDAESEISTKLGKDEYSSQTVLTRSEDGHA